jgi:hypothetical protein
LVAAMTAAERRLLYNTEQQHLRGYTKPCKELQNRGTAIVIEIDEQIVGVDWWRLAASSWRDEPETRKIIATNKW